LDRFVVGTVQCCAHGSTAPTIAGEGNKRKQEGVKHRQHRANVIPTFVNTRYLFSWYMVSMHFLFCSCLFSVRLAKYWSVWHLRDAGCRWLCKRRKWGGGGKRVYITG